MDAIQLYPRNYVDNRFERLELFELLAKRYGIKRAVYAGSYVHITPSFAFPAVTYVDSDRRARTFFADPAIKQYIDGRKRYAEDTLVTYYAANYQTDFGAREQHFDLLISQYAGFVSQACKHYLKVGGLLVANNSHGNAGLASIDEDYLFVAAIHKSSTGYRLVESDLDAYFRPKTPTEVTRELLERLGRGIGYTRTADDYVFQRTQ